VLATLGCTGREQIRIDGSSTVYPLSEAVAEEYRKVEPRVNVTVGRKGTGGGFERFIAGEIDICDASRPIKEVEEEACRKKGIEFVRFEVAFDGLAVVVHPENDWAETLTTAQLQQIWRPDNAAQKWSDLNAAWPNATIKLYGPGADSGTFDYFTEVIVGKEDSSRTDYSQSEDDNVIVLGVSQDKYALGYFGYAYFAENQSKLKLVAVDSGSGPVTPSTETVRSGTYTPLSRPLFIYVRKDALGRPEVQTFVEFYLQAAGKLAEDVGYVPVSEDVASANKKAFEESTSVSVTKS
jgi:phosphate transport system substrate-binding protein